MALLRRSDLPSTMGGSMLSDFFDDRFMTPQWLRGDTMPAVNIRESDKKYEIELAAPGYQKSDFNVTLDNGILTVSAETKDEKETGPENYRRREFTCRSFSRSFALPENVEDKDVDAVYLDGLLKLSINKKQDGSARPKRTIQIK
jgi:HSP20 family protein